MTISGVLRRRLPRGSSATRTCFPARCTGQEDAFVARLADAEVPVGNADINGPAWLVLRPESIRVEAKSAGGVAATVRDVAFRGTGFTYGSR